MLLRRNPFGEKSPISRRKPFTPAISGMVLQEYQSFVTTVGTQIGELTPLLDEDVHDVRLLLHLAARVMGCRARTWVDQGKVYFYIRRDNIGAS
jgi:hypothetical protein